MFIVLGGLVNHSKFVKVADYHLDTIGIDFETAWHELRRIVQFKIHRTDPIDIFHARTENAGNARIDNYSPDAWVMLAVIAKQPVGDVSIVTKARQEICLCGDFVSISCAHIVM